MSENTKDLQRLKLFREYENGTFIGEVDGIKNVNSLVWKDFKDISRLYGNSEGAALTACVQAYLSNPVNFIKLEQMRNKPVEVQDAPK